MSQLKVLIVGKHPNLALYAWRFQLAKSVEVYQVGSQDEGEIEIVTKRYGSDRFTLKKQFAGMEEMIDENEKFDMVIMAACSLQEISGITSQVNSVINNNSKIFVESSGFVNIEPFVRMSLQFSQSKVFSIMSDYDMRRTDDGVYMQQNGGFDGTQKIYIGEAGGNGNKSYSTDGVSGSYSKNTTSLLTTFHSLFSKLFPKDEIELCNFSPMEFLKEQWKMAIPRICFDPLLILFEELNPEKLRDQILAKPLISGLVTEIITLVRAMGCRLPNGFENESNLLKRWASYNGNNTPSLFYHFIHKSAPLDIDMLLLQPILLADDYSIKTPYLEFLYSMMCQFQKLNSEKSKFFTRSHKTIQPNNELKKVSALEQTLKIKENEFESKLREIQAGFETHSVSMQEQIDSLKQQLQQERSNSQKLGLDLEKSESIVSSLKKELMQFQQNVSYHKANSESPHTPTNATALQNLTINTKREEMQYTDTGTPILKGFEDIALYGIAYKNSPESVAKQVQTSDIENGVSPNEATKVTTIENLPSITDQSLRERELELRRKEVELQERELDLKRKQSQTMLNQKAHPKQANKMLTNVGTNKQQSQVRPGAGVPYKSHPKIQGPHGHMNQYNSVPHQSQQQFHQAPNSLAVTHVSQRQAYTMGVPPTSVDSALPMMGTMYPQKQFQKTSRKNRRSHMPILRNPSSTMLNDYSMPQTHPTYNNQQQGQSRYNSLSGNIQGPTFQNNNSSTIRVNTQPNVVNSHGQLQSFQPSQPHPQVHTFASENNLRKASTSTMLDEGKSLESVIHKPPTSHPPTQPPTLSSYSKSGTSSSPDYGNSSVITQSSEPTEPIEPVVDISEKKSSHTTAFTPEESKKKSKFFFLAKK